MDVVLNETAVRELKASLRGEAILPGGDDARRLWNSTIDKRPALLSLAVSGPPM